MRALLLALLGALAPTLVRADERHVVLRVEEPRAENGRIVCSGRYVIEKGWEAKQVVMQYFPMGGAVATKTSVPALGTWVPLQTPVLRPDKYVVVVDLVIVNAKLGKKETYSSVTGQISVP